MVTGIETCPFCSSDDIDYRIIHEDDLFFSFLSNPRARLAHGLVVPRRHIENPRDITDAEWGGMMREAHRLGRAILRLDEYVGYQVGAKFDPSVPSDEVRVAGHYHEHVLGRTPEDPLMVGLRREDFTQLPATELANVLPVLKRAS